MKTNRVSLIIIPVVLIAFIAVALFATQTPARDANAQDTSLSMRSLLERLRARMDADPNFLVTVQFFDPPVPETNQWIIPSNLTEEGSTRRFGEIGDEYVCFAEVGPSFNNSVCVLYSNISMVIYSN
ncbi:MAG TPA: hypothetical protein VK003_06640 [Oceanobacillus sp.]|nr:hypothetical protein [Oceanobacillus sp.]